MVYANSISRTLFQEGVRKIPSQYGSKYSALFSSSGLNMIICRSFREYKAGAELSVVIVTFQGLPWHLPQFYKINHQQLACRLPIFCAQRCSEDLHIVTHSGFMTMLRSFLSYKETQLWNHHIRLSLRPGRRQVEEWPGYSEQWTSHMSPRAGLSEFLAWLSTSLPTFQSAAWS